jgi:hypothetical protein
VVVISRFILRARVKRQRKFPVRHRRQRSWLLVRAV